MQYTLYYYTIGFVEDTKTYLEKAWKEGDEEETSLLEKERVHQVDW